MNYPHIAQLFFNRPLLLSEQRAQVILGALMPYFEGGQVKGAQVDNVDLPQERAEPVEISGDGVVVIPILGTLVNRKRNMDALSGGPTAYSEIRQHIISAIADDSIKGIILDIDSGGGEANGAFDLADFIRVASEQKPIMAMVDENALSGGYVLASGATQIVVPRTGSVGSIGVVVAHVDQSEFDKKQGFNVSFIQAGKLKTDGNVHEPLSNDTRERIQAEVDLVYNLFVSGVAERRGLSEQAVRETEAGIFFGGDAVARELADVVASRGEAIGGFIDMVTRPTAVHIGRPFAATFKETFMMKKEESKTIDTEVPVPTISNEEKEKAALILVEEQKLELEAQLKKAESSLEDKAKSEAANTEYAEYVDSINGICQLAGKYELAQSFIAKKIGADQVRKSLLEARVQEDEATAIMGQHQAQDDATTNKKAKVEPINSVYARFNEQMSGKR